MIDFFKRILKQERHEVQQKYLKINENEALARRAYLTDTVKKASEIVSIDHVTGKVIIDEEKRLVEKQNSYTGELAKLFNILLQKYGLEKDKRKHLEILHQERVEAVSEKLNALVKDGILEENTLSLKKNEEQKEIIDSLNKDIGIYVQEIDRVEGLIDNLIANLSLLVPTEKISIIEVHLNEIKAKLTLLNQQSGILIEKSNKGLSVTNELKEHDVFKGEIIKNLYNTYGIDLDK